MWPYRSKHQKALTKSKKMLRKQYPWHSSWFSSRWPSLKCELWTRRSVSYWKMNKNDFVSSWSSHRSKQASSSENSRMISTHPSQTALVIWRSMWRGESKNGAHSSIINKLKSSALNILLGAHKVLLLRAWRRALQIVFISHWLQSIPSFNRVSQQILFWDYVYLKIYRFREHKTQS